MDFATLLPADWSAVLADDLRQPTIAKLEAFLAAERAAHSVFPPEADVFRALKLAPFERVRVVILGQDPYHDDGQAHGLAFSVRPGVKPPPSLVNMFKEMETDIELPRPSTGFLEPWARQGVLLLNTVLTVRAHSPASHQKQGWETFTDAVIRAVAMRGQPAIFVLWGAHAHKKLRLIEAAQVHGDAAARHLTTPVCPLPVQQSLRQPGDERANARECEAGTQSSIASSTQIVETDGASSPSPPRKRDLPPPLHKRGLTLTARCAARRRDAEGSGDTDIIGTRHVVIASAHPSPLSARNGFFGSRPFSRINAALQQMGHEAIDWRL